jgi:hypothetical protein
MVPLKPANDLGVSLVWSRSSVRDGPMGLPRMSRAGGVVAFQCPSRDGSSSREPWALWGKITESL